MFNPFRNFIRAYNDKNVIHDLENVKKEVAQLRTEWNIFEADIMDSILGRIERLNKRMQTKMSRELAQTDDFKEPAPRERASRVLFGNKNRVGM